MGTDHSRGDDGDATIVTSGATRAPATLSRGAVVSRYVIVDRLGSGAMGAVYSAYDPELDRKVAVKLLHETSGDSLGVLREAQALARLSHPNVVAVHDAGRHDGRVFLAMEYVAGSNLRNWSCEEPREIDQILRVFIAAGRGLAAAHAAGIVHRDFKPDNVMVGVDGTARVADFGLAELTAASTTGEGSDVALRRPTGTPAYMAPEQRLGFAVDARADQYSFCVALFEALAGRRPFGEQALEHLADAEARLPEETPRRVPMRIRRVLRVGLAPSPEHRHADMDSLLARIVEAQRSLPHRALRPAIALAAVATVAAVVWSSQHREQPCDRADEVAAAVWGADQREEVRNALGGSNERYISTSLTTTLRTLDEWTSRWREQWHDACEAAHVRREQSIEQFELREACLESGRLRAQAVIELLSNRDAGVAEHAVDEVSGLPDPDVCGDLEVLRGRVPPPDSQDVAERVREIRANLSRVSALRTALRMDQAQALAEESLHAADATGYLPVRAEARSSLARTLNDPLRAAELHVESIAMATTVGHDREAATSLISLVVEFRRTRALDEALRWAALADAVVLRLGDPPKQRFDLLVNLSHLAGERGDVRAATAHADGAMALVEATGALATRRGEAHTTRASAARFAGDYSQAAEEAGLAYTHNVLTLGELHPKTLNALQIATVAHSDRGDFGGAIAMTERLIGQLSDDPRMARARLDARSNLGLFLGMIGRFDESRALLAEVETEYGERSGVESRDFAEARSNRAMIELHAGHLDTARTLAEQSDALLTRIANGQPTTGPAKATVAEIALAQERFVEARDQYLLALAIMIPAFGATHPVTVESASHLAHAQARLGDGDGAWTRIEPLLALATLPRPVRAIVLADAVLIAELTDDPRLPELRAQLEGAKEALGSGQVWVRDDLARWARIDAAARARR